ncbi:EF-P lysine aminoacylase EpmA [Marinimicrobium alkaliphilum]|uniref:EF-P lysine aminoacylase EpmA n=1 Tax=Marinimicrobium alkaliphilum TaxID=2202654 RepID=UPI000DB9771E|nr:EF-P lysine aminoacylase EpmA [Marinimicrobium alkaliphilum]
MSWQPSASLERLAQRAAINRQIRTFFDDRGVMEVELPVLGRAPVTDPFIEPIRARCNGATRYLQTSPEYAMKRLLAAGSGPIYSLGKAFRDGESGRRHNPEFTLLEWYRPGWDDTRLMDEVAELVGHLHPGVVVTRLRYRDWFVEHLGIDPHRATGAELAAVGRAHVEIDLDESDRDAWMDLLVTHVLEPRLPEGLVLVSDYPASQAALARIVPDPTGQPVARRFEAFLNRMELANGYWELTDAEEQRQRFETDLAKREGYGLPQYPIDESLLAALTAGMPACAGVALGVDRLLMTLLKAEGIADVLSFDTERA